MITRAATPDDELRLLLESRGARVIECPTIEFRPPLSWEPVDAAIARLESYDWLLFTSAHAVDCFMSRKPQIGPPTQIASVGPATRKRIEKWNLTVARVPRDFRAEGLLAAFPADLAGTRILFPRAESGREILPDELVRRGAVVDLVTVYRTVRMAGGNSRLLKLLESEKVDCVVFTSPSSFEGFDPQSLQSVRIAALGPVTQQAIEQTGLKVSIVPPRATIPDLVDAMDRFFDMP